MAFRFLRNRSLADMHWRVKYWGFWRTGRASKKPSNRLRRMSSWWDTKRQPELGY